MDMRSHQQTTLESRHQQNVVETGHSQIGVGKTETGHRKTAVGKKRQVTGRQQWKNRDRSQEDSSENFLHMI